MTSLVSSKNSANLNLQPGQFFDGEFEQVLEYSQISVLVILAEGQRATLTISYSPDASSGYVFSKSTIVGRADSYEHIFEIISKYYKIRVSADQGTTVEGKVHTIHHLYKTKPVSNFLNEAIGDSHSCEIQRSVVTGSTFGKHYQNVNIEKFGTSASSLLVSIANPATSFGELKIAEPTPIIQASAIYNSINPQTFTTYIYNSQSSERSTVFSDDGAFTIRASSNEGSYAILKTRRQCMYRSGQGFLIQFTGSFPQPGNSNTLQLCGFGNRGNGVYFGYSNENFGCLLRTKGRAPICKITVTSAANVAGNIVITLAGIAYTVPVSNASGVTQYTAYEIAKHAYIHAGHELWTAEAIGNVVTFTYYNGATITGINSVNPGVTGMTIDTNIPMLVSSGSNITDVFFPQDQWNIDKMDGSGPSGTQIDTTKGNVYSIQMQGLGAGRICFGIHDNTGRIVPVHHIIYATNSVIPPLEVPHGAISAIAETVGENVVIEPTCKISSMIASIEGQVVKHPPMYSSSSTKLLISTNETNLMAIKIRNNFNLFSTVAELYMTSMSFAVDAGETAVILRVYLNPVLSPIPSISDYPNFHYIDENFSVALVDTTSSTVSGGILVYQGTTVKDSSFQIPEDLLKNSYIGKDDTIVVTAQGKNNRVTVNAVWYEQK